MLEDLAVVVYSVFYGGWVAWDLDKESGVTDQSVHEVEEYGVEVFK